MASDEEMLTTLRAMLTREVQKREAAEERAAALGKLVELIAAEAWYGRDAPYYAEMRRILEDHKRAW